ncbi:hypothetical protein L7F22_026215 [Adiantum nelumboides]|nr:hypothetical protein [Adiantum nelumboides]
MQGEKKAALGKAPKAQQTKQVKRCPSLLVNAWVYLSMPKCCEIVREIVSVYRCQHVRDLNVVEGSGTLKAQKRNQVKEVSSTAGTEPPKTQVNTRKANGKEEEGTVIPEQRNVKKLKKIKEVGVHEDGDGDGDDDSHDGSDDNASDDNASDDDGGSDDSGGNDDNADANNNGADEKDGNGGSDKGDGKGASEGNEGQDVSTDNEGNGDEVSTKDDEDSADNVNVVMPYEVAIDM